MAHFDLQQVITFFSGILTGLGLAENRARLIATRQVEIHAFGVTTHGLWPLLGAIAAYKGGKAVAGHIETVRDHGAVCVLDGSSLPGVEAQIHAVECLSEKVDQHGMAWVSLIDTSWVGVLGYHAAILARRGCFVQSWAQMSNDPKVCPHGGMERRFSTNPLCFVMPAEPDPIVADFSTSIIASGKVFAMNTKGQHAPEPICRTVDGEPSTDPAAFVDGGTILPLGGLNYGFRGMAMAMWNEMLTAAAGGRSCNPDRRNRQSLHLFAIRGDLLGDRATYLAEAKRLVAHVLSAKPVPGNAPPRLPGAWEWQQLAEARDKGLELDEGSVAKLQEVASEHGLVFPQAL